MLLDHAVRQSYAVFTRRLAIGVFVIAETRWTGRRTGIRLMIESREVPYRAGPLRFVSMESFAVAHSVLWFSRVIITDDFVKRRSAGNRVSSQPARDNGRLHATRVQA